MKGSGRRKELVLAWGIYKDAGSDGTGVAKQRGRSLVRSDRLGKGTQLGMEAEGHSSGQGRKERP